MSRKAFPRLGTPVVTLGDNALALDVLFERYITDDAECDVSVRAKEPDEVGRKRSGAFAYFGPIKVSRRGATRWLEP
ncbi:hypothetical protein GCM10009085_00920 [Pseudomonas avellanae]|nr:hypothetical protein GCM10009085_00920 [Pseudomonas avellanae]